MKPEEFKILYQDISDITSRVKELVGSATNFLGDGIDILASEFDYEFVEAGPLKDQLLASCKRMIISRVGYLHSDRNSAFEDFSRAIQIQVEGLINIWFAKYYLTEGRTVKTFASSYTDLKTRQVLKKDFTSFIEVLEGEHFLDYKKFCLDFNTLNKNEFDAIYGSIIKTFIIPANKYHKTVFKINYMNSYKEFNKIDKMQYLTKIEFFYLLENGYHVYFTNHPLNRLNELRNAVLSHAGFGYDASKEYYKELYGQSNRFEILIKSFHGLYNLVKSKIASVEYYKADEVTKEDKPIEEELTIESVTIKPKQNNVFLARKSKKR